MPGKYYNFDPNSLKYRNNTPGIKERIRKGLTFFSISLLIAVVAVSVYFSIAGSPKMKNLEKKNAQLLAKYEAIKNNFSTLDSTLAEISFTDDSIYRVIIETPPVSPEVREGGFGGSDRYRNLEDLDHADLVVSAAKELDILSKKVDIQLFSYNEVLKKAKEKDRMLASLPAISPIPEKQIGYVSDYFGYRIHPIYKKRIYHWGVDLTADIGTEIHAPGDGVVEEINYASSGYGKVLVINHGFGFKTLYGHLSRYNVQKGDSVKRGDVIAFVGNAGTSTGAHLHYEIIRGNKKINPFNYFTIKMDPKDYSAIISKQ